MPKTKWGSSIRSWLFSNVPDGVFICKSMRSGKSSTSIRDLLSFALQTALREVFWMIYLLLCVWDCLWYRSMVDVCHPPLERVMAMSLVRVVVAFSGICRFHFDYLFPSQTSPIHFLQSICKHGSQSIVRQQRLPVLTARPGNSTLSIVSKTLNFWGRYCNTVNSMYSETRK